MTLIEFYKIYDSIDNAEQVRDVLMSNAKPDELCGVKLPDNLNHLTLGELLELQYMDENSVLDVIASVILKKKSADMLLENVNDVFGFIGFVKNEIDRINKLFSDIAIPPTPDELRAGVKKLNFGAFGIIDWYAKRMGMTNHEDAENTPWLRVFQCQRIDNETKMYEKRLHEIMYKKKK